jgi:hypothetical protein
MPWYTVRERSDPKREGGAAAHEERVDALPKIDYCNDEAGRGQRKDRVALGAPELLEIMGYL